MDLIILLTQNRSFLWEIADQSMTKTELIAINAQGQRPNHV